MRKRLQMERVLMQACWAGAELRLNGNRRRKTKAGLRAELTTLTAGATLPSARASTAQQRRLAGALGALGSWGHWGVDVGSSPGFVTCFRGLSLCGVGGVGCRMQGCKVQGGDEECGVQDVGCRGQEDAGFGLHCAGCSVQGAECGIKSAGCRVQGAGCSAQGIAIPILLAAWGQGQWSNWLGTCREELGFVQPFLEPSRQ